MYTTSEANKRVWFGKEIHGGILHTDGSSISFIMVAKTIIFKEISHVRLLHYFGENMRILGEKGGVV